MSNVNIKRAVENIKANTTVYTPIAEVVVNAIQAIEARGGEEPGEVTIRVIRSPQRELNDALSSIETFEVQDNGVGFTDEHRDSFDTLYSDLKIEEGGKGFGRFTCLKYFEDLRVDSVFKNGEGWQRRTFAMGKETEIIVNERVVPSESEDTGTTVALRQIKNPNLLNKKLGTIGRNLVEKLLPYFISEDYECPNVTLVEGDGSDSIRLNEFVRNELSAEVVEVPLEQPEFSLSAVDGEETFQVRVFKIFFPKNHKSRVSLVAHKREVSGSILQRFIPEFSEEFYEENLDGGEGRDRNYIIKAYVFADFLDRTVSLERGGFEFQVENDLFFGISQAQIEEQAAKLAKEAVGADISLRQDKKKADVQAYVDEEAPWHKSVIGDLDMTSLPYNPRQEDIEIRLQKLKFDRESEIRRDVAKLLAEGSLDDLQEQVLKTVGMISGSSRDELAHYVALRKNILELFRKSLERKEDEKYSTEGVVHDIIFPRKGDSDTTAFEDHNLWILDERLNFTSYVSSDVPLEGPRSDRPDLLVYDKRILFRGDNEPSNPVSIFEFKKPDRDDFVNPSSREDPVQQIVRYVNKISDGRYKTPEGRRMLVAQNTPFYGFVVCDLSSKVEDWLEKEKDFKPMPDRLGWFRRFDNINLYIEVLSWDKVLRDAEVRNRIFFEKLGIQ